MARAMAVAESAMGARPGLRRRLAVARLAGLFCESRPCIVTQPAQNDLKGLLTPLLMSGRKVLVLERRLENDLAGGLLRAAGWFERDGGLCGIAHAEPRQVDNGRSEAVPADA
jgi:hypothetical protein